MKSDLLFYLVLFGVGGVVVWLLLRKTPQVPYQPIADPNATNCKLQVTVPGYGGIGGTCEGFMAIPKIAEQAVKSADNIIVQAAKTGSGYTIVKAGVDGVKGWFQGNTTNCSVAQQPENAMWCRQKYGFFSAPGSDAWARAHGVKILYSGEGSS